MFSDTRAMEKQWGVWALRLRGRPLQSFKGSETRHTRSVRQAVLPYKGDNEREGGKGDDSNNGGTDDALLPTPLSANSSAIHDKNRECEGIGPWLAENDTCPICIAKVELIETCNCLRNHHTS